MPKKIISPFNMGASIATAPQTPAQPKSAPDGHLVTQIAGSYVVYNNESGSEVARFDSFGDALAEQARRNTISQKIGLT